MKKLNTSLWIFIIYIIAQLSAAVAVPVIMPLVSDGRTFEEAYLAASGWWMFIAFGMATIAALVLSRMDRQYFKTPKGRRSPLWVAIVLGITGFFMVLFGQGAAGMIEQALGIEPGSDNTATLVSVADMAPVAIIAVVLFAPILEEFIFRRIIFGGLVDRTNFFVAAAVSSLVFAAVHMDFTHILLYAASGFIFAFLYHVTKRLITSIIAHMLLNGFVMVVQLNIDKIQEFIDQMERIANMQ